MCNTPSNNQNTEKTRQFTGLNKVNTEMTMVITVTVKNVICFISIQQNY